MKKYALVMLVALLASCGKKNVPQTTTRSDINRFQEDLSDVRPKFAVEPSPTATGKKPEEAINTPTTIVKNSLDVTKRLETALDTIAQLNKAIRYAQGYRIQIYSGSDRREAENAKSASYQLFPKLTPYLIYNQPSYRVKAGDFLDRVEAEKYYVAFKAAYPNALVVPDKVDIRKSVSTN